MIWNPFRAKRIIQTQDDLLREYRTELKKRQNAIRTAALPAHSLLPSDWVGDRQQAAAKIISTPVFREILASVRANILADIVASARDEQAKRLQVFDNAVGALLALRTLESTGEEEKPGPEALHSSYGLSDQLLQTLERQEG